MNIDDSGGLNSRSGNVAIQSRNATRAGSGRLPARAAADSPRGQRPTPRAGSGQLPAGLYSPVVSRRNFLPATQRRVSERDSRLLKY